ncbi:MAG TPA: hypothetical protein VG457_18805 [Planctomycetota bacterium]|jgi:hypothetical protein|nr:hypothetical protein [Planctomycetota bacterium]
MIRLIRLFGFEEGMADLVASKFTFSDPSYDQVVLSVGRNVFVSTLKEDQDILLANPSFDPTREPVIALGSNTGRGVQPSSSSSSKQEWNLLVVMRHRKAPEVVKGLLENLCDFLLVKRGRISTGFQIKGSKMMARPTVLGVLPNDNALVSSVIQFMGVPLQL